MDRATPKTDKELAVELTQTFIAEWMRNGINKPNPDTVAGILTKFHETLITLRSKE